MLNGQLRLSRPGCLNENHSVIATVHPDTVADGARIACLFNLDVVGIGLITPDITNHLAEVVV